MELSTTTINTLKLVGESNFDENAYNTLLKEIFDSFIINKSFQLDVNLNDSALNDLKIQQLVIKDSLAALITLTTELAKHDYDATNVSSYLDELGFSAEKIKTYTTYYNSKKPFIRMMLNNLTFSYDHIVDVKWRLDYTIKENNIERINQANYLIELKVEKPGAKELSTIQFFCTVDQLQDFVYKLKEASKSLEKLMQQP